VNVPVALLDLTLDTSEGVHWNVNGNPIQIDWAMPTLQYVINGTYNLPTKNNALFIYGDGWTFWLIQNDSPLPHSLHLHGHDVYVIGKGLGNGANVPLNHTSPQRRDTFVVDAGGYVTIAIETTNPGAWLLHGHVPWHIVGGLGVQFLVQPTEILRTLGDLKDFRDGCTAWRKYQTILSNSSGSGL
jgi:FtsP/CotA-like multicopper oxidase with cupredoxin domain